jgi:hypothetical protein
MTEYEIKPPSLRCARTGRELKPGEIYYSTLTASADGFVRTDFAEEAWSGPPQGAIGFWRARVPAAGRSRPQFVHDSVLVDFFEQLADETDPQKVNFRYILALLLMRKKILKLAGADTESGRDVLLVRAAATGEVHRVVNPGLSEQELGAVQAEVERVLMKPTE